VTGAKWLLIASWTSQYGNSNGASIQLQWDAIVGLFPFKRNLGIADSKD